MSELRITRTDWASVAKLASQKIGRKYVASYCSEVASGYRRNLTLEPFLQSIGVMDQSEDERLSGAPLPSLKKIDPPQRPTQVFIPEEAKPYCNPFGIIDWKKVHALVVERLGLSPDDLLPWHLYGILYNGVADDRGIASVLLELKLDRVVSRVMVRGSGRTHESHRNAIKMAQERGVDLGRVIGSGPNGLVLQRDVVAYLRGYSYMQVVSQDTDARLLRQRRILANHLRTSIQSARSLRVELDESESRVAATALRLGEEIAAKVSDIEVLREHIAAVTTDRNLLRAHLDESRSTIERLSKAVRTRRITHIRLGNELFRNRTKERV